MTEAVTGLKQTNSLRGNIFWWKRVDGIWSILPKSAVERSRESWTHFWKRREYWGTATSYAVRAKVRKVVQFVHALFMVEIWSLHKFFTWPVIFSYMSAFYYIYIYFCCFILIIYIYIYIELFFLNCRMLKSLWGNVECNVGFSYNCTVLRKKMLAVRYRWLELVFYKWSCDSLRTVPSKPTVARVALLVFLHFHTSFNYLLFFQY